MSKIQEPEPQEIADLRAACGLNPAEFGALAHVSDATVYSWESGRRGCSAAHWELLLIYFGLTKPRTLERGKARSSRTASLEELELELIHKRVQLLRASHEKRSTSKR